MSTLTLDRRHQLNGLAWMVVGSLTIFTLLLYVNESAPEAERNKHSAMTEFQVQQPVKPKPKKQVKKRIKQQHNVRRPALPSADLGVGMSGLDFGMPDYSMDDMGDVDDSLLGNTDDVVMTSEMVSVAPMARTRAPLEYPARAKSKEVEGYVVLSILIDENGEVQTVKVIEASPVDVFEDAAVRSIKNWQFAPARYEGKAVKTWANQTIRFELG